MAIFQQPNQEKDSYIEIVETVEDPIKEELLLSALKAYDFMSKFCCDIGKNFEKRAQKILSGGKASLPTITRLKMDAKAVNTFIDRLELFYNCIKTSVSGSTTAECKKFMVFNIKVINIIKDFLGEDLDKSQQKSNSKKFNRNHKKKTIAELDMDSKICLIVSLSEQVRIFLEEN